jgi:predicted RNA-binding Zn ribbon-like protein
MKQSLQVIPLHRFTERDFVGGDAALDFVNTVAGRDQAPRDRLDAYVRLLEWSAGTDLLPGKLLRTLSRKAQAEPAAASKALARAKALREAMFTVVTAMISENAPSKSALALLREHWIAGARAHELRFSDGRVALELDADAADLDLIASIAAYRLVENVLSLPVERLRLCAGSDCAWLFIDGSKAGRRRWCDMAVCGNKAKSRRFYARERKAN